MIRRLCDITIAEFVDILEGDYTPLLDKEEKADPKEIRDVVSGIIAEYKEITDPAGMRSSLIEREEYKKLQARIILFGMCKRMIALLAYDDVREVLALIGEDTDISDDKLDSKIDIMLRRVIFEKKKIDDTKDQEDPATPAIDIRKSFDSEQAFLMRLFKMQIDTRTLSASVYANLVKQAGEEVKQMRRQK